MIVEGLVRENIAKTIETNNVGMSMEDTSFSSVSIASQVVLIVYI